MTKLQELQATIVSTSERGHEERFEFWAVLQSDIKAAIKDILKNDEAENIDSSYYK